MAVRESKSRERSSNAPQKVAESNSSKGAQEILQKAFNRVPIGMSLVDRSGKILQANPAICDLLGYTEKELLAKSRTSSRVGKPSKDPLQTFCVNGNISRPGEAQDYVHSDGHLVHLKPSRYTISDGDGSFYFLWQFDQLVEARPSKNVTDPRPAELVQERAEETAALGDQDLLATAAHELRTLLSSILGFSSTMFVHWDDLSREERYEFLRRIERRGHQLSELVDNLLTVHSLEDQPARVSHDFVSVAEVVKETVDDLSEWRPGIEWSCPSDLKVMVDRDHLRRMLANYLANALKYGKLPIAIKAEERDGWMHLEVRDRGEGVSAGLAPRLFEKFSREQAANNGTGLGLWIVRGLAHAHRGEVSYEPNPGGGSCFSLRLPHPAAHHAALPSHARTLSRSSRPQLVSIPLKWV